MWWAELRRPSQSMAVGRVTTRCGDAFPKGNQDYVSHHTVEMHNVVGGAQVPQPINGYGQGHEQEMWGCFSFGGIGTTFPINAVDILNVVGGAQVFLPINGCGKGRDQELCTHPTTTVLLQETTEET